MRKWVTGILIGAILVGMAACAPKSQEDCGFVQNVYGERISWKGQVPVVLRIHSSVPSEFVGAIEAAVKSWNDAAGKELLQLAASPRVTGTAVGEDRNNVISFASTWNTDKLSEQAKTSVHWVGDQIREADIQVNNFAMNGASVFNFYWQQKTANGVNLEALILHEIGHVLGMKHKDRDSSVMNTYLAANADRVALAETDVSSLQCEY
jgi:hypothetical protein